MAYLGVHVCTSETENVYFDTDAVYTVLDSGYSVTLSIKRSDFITYKPSTGKVQGLGLHNIVGADTVNILLLR